MEETSGSHPSEDKHADEPPAATVKTAQSSAISVYHVKIMGVPRAVTVAWCKSLINHSLAVSVEKPSADAPFACKIDLKPWPFWSKKGFKTFSVDGRRVDIYWDLRGAKFSGSPEPSGGYYVALVCNEEVVLLLGDHKKEAYKRTKSRPSLEDATLVTKKENVVGKKSFTARAKFDDRRKEHEIVVENSISGPKDPEMWISVDGVVVVHVNNLRWKFRGNKTVIVEQVPVQVFWDAHDWLFGSPGTGHALFIFKPGAPPERSAEDERQPGGEAGSSPNEADCSPVRPCCGGGGGLVPEFCFFLYAWKME